jgi:hypothetical protein
MPASRLYNRTVPARLPLCSYLIQAEIILMPPTVAFSRRLDYVLEVVFTIALVAMIFDLLGLHSFA